MKLLLNSVILFAYCVSAKNTTELIFACKDLFKHCRSVVLIEHQVDEYIHCSGCNINLCVCQKTLHIVLK